MGEGLRYLVCARGTMTGLVKCVVFSCAVCLVVGLTGVRDDVNWFKNGQRIKNRFVTGVVNGIMDAHCSDRENGDDVEGECLSKLECTKTGGRVGGLCSLLGSCCVIKKTCNETTSAKLSYFVPPANATEDCSLRVNIYSKDVCQIRLDFERFEIAQPTSKPLKGEDPKKVTEAYKCHDDRFMVENVGKNLGFTYLCGKNNGQHIYIPVAENKKSVNLRFTFNEKLKIRRDWRIKIRQLECRRSGYDQILTAPSKLMAMYNTLKNKKKPQTDYEWLAPPNCLQYYREKNGTFESFNYNDGNGCYIGNLHYAICFRRTPEICGAVYTSGGVFQMNQNKFEATEEDKPFEMCHPREESGPTVSQDYIYIPRGKDSANEYRDFYCDRHFNNNTVTAKFVGPLHVGVHTDGFRPNIDQEGSEGNDEFDKFAEVGFKLNYQLLSGNCDDDDF